MSAWPEVAFAKSENRHEIKLAGASISNRISENGLDKTIFSVTHLNLLNISDTCLETIPDDIKRLVNLQTLLLFGNKIHEFNVNITSLSKLKVLDLSRNQLNSIPDLSNMKELTSINFSNNVIEEMPQIGDMPNLITLDVSNNKLKAFINIENANLPHLTDVKMKGNIIEELPAHVARSMPSLKNFDLGDNQLKTIPGEVASMSKLKEFNLKGNKLSDKRFMKLVDQCRTKQILDYIRDHCPKGDSAQPTGKAKGKKGKKEEPPPESQEDQLCHALKILHVEDNVIRVKILEQNVANVRPYILCCVVKDLAFDDALFKKFIQLQTKLHDTVCDKRNTATIATHDLGKMPPGDLTYTAKPPAALKLTPLSRLKPCSGEHLVQQLTAEAEALRKEKKRNVYSGIHKYLYLLEGKPLYPCLQDAAGKVISFPPITNSDITKIQYGDTCVSPGDNLSPLTVPFPPDVAWDCNEMLNYTLILVDPDVPGLEQGKELLHWWVDRIPDCDLSRGRTVAAYLAPNPPPGSGRHRYCFYLFQDCTCPCYATAPVTQGTVGRVNFSAKDFAKKYGDPWAGNFYLSGVISNMSVDSKSMLVEVTSHSSLGACKLVMDKVLQECLLLGIGEKADGFHTLTVQQVKVVDTEGNLKNVYPSRTDCVYEGVDNIKILRLNKK